TATMNARISAMLQYVLCCSRVAHFLRIEARNKIGSSQSAREVEDHLNRWITRYVTPDTNAPASLKAEYPLQQANVLVEELPGKPGEFRVVIHLLPHYQLDSLSSTMTLTARHVTGPGTN
ncbi:type VI secretion system contractile sheath large subunit, partial [bacterium]|nr:type VI secretion system contractile sheath large subunit [bacterium]